VVEAHDDLVNRADFHALTCVVKELADSQRELAEAQRELTEAQRELTEAQKRTESTVEGLAAVQKKMLIRLDKVDGRSLEIDVARHLPAFVGRVFRRCRVVDPLDVVESVEDRLSEAECGDLLRSDIIATARLDDRPVHLMVEVSCTADSDDVERARRRAEALSRAGLPTIGIVACESIGEQTLAFAQRQGVRILLEGLFMPAAA
jgi:hypothetical protein